MSLFVTQFPKKNSLFISVYFSIHFIHIYVYKYTSIFETYSICITIYIGDRFCFNIFEK